MVEVFEEGVAFGGGGDADAGEVVEPEGTFGRRAKAVLEFGKESIDVVWGLGVAKAVVDFKAE